MRMERRFQWDAERIRFFCDAAQSSDYHRTLAALLAPELHPQDSVLDAGCGLGYLSEALLPYCSCVTAADCDQNAIAALQERTAGEDRFNALCADVHTLDTSFDVIVCCYFGSVQEAVQLFQRLHAKKLILVKRKRAERRFSTQLPAHERTAAEAEAILKDSGLRCHTTDAAIAFDQPFRSTADAARFFSLYRKQTVSAEEAESLCEKTDDPVFPFRLPVINEIRIFSIGS